MKTRVLTKLKSSVARIFMGAVLLTSFPARSHQDAITVQKQAEAELLSLHRQERQAHFNHDVDFFLAHVAPELLDVREGRVNRMTRDDVAARFLKYFKHARFSAWDDVEPPIVHASPDGKIGWMIVRVRIVYTNPDVSGSSSSEDSVGAWMSAYAKQNGRWVLTAVTSTFSDQ